jgi:hypothetical protein
MRTETDCIASQLAANLTTPIGVSDEIDAE